ncbi:hypothetical protein KC640_01800 [Candidatus Dojkabacteria bacterium]|uniref:Uncharacterized protein n=1 Tax=Candidatus Dojkabacteria bacterium TaxID=2099670 RepID=A0A955ICZ8_9BACT|nr:hypothetical protein [Candidatus Dojkabacteria bacterium]
MRVAFENGHQKALLAIIEDVLFTAQCEYRYGEKSPVCISWLDEFRHVIANHLSIILSSPESEAVIKKCGENDTVTFQGSSYITTEKQLMCHVFVTLLHNEFHSLAHVYPSKENLRQLLPQQYAGQTVFLFVNRQPHQDYSEKIAFGDYTYPLVSILNEQQNCPDIYHWELFPNSNSTHGGMYYVMEQNYLSIWHLEDNSPHLMFICNSSQLMEQLVPKEKTRSN